MIHKHTLEDMSNTRGSINHSPEDVHSWSGNTVLDRQKISSEFNIYHSELIPNGSQATHWPHMAVVQCSQKSLRFGSR